MARILGVGNATLDIINHVVRYPAEDSEQRAVSQTIRRGGNVANTLVVLSQLGHQCGWGGVLTDEPETKHICSDFDQFHVDYEPAHIVTSGKVPTSYILSNKSNGSRTIVHIRDLPEYPARVFTELDLEQYQWIHFECRDVAELKAMLEYLEVMHPHIRVSVEIEKHRSGLEQITHFPGLVIFSRAFANEKGFREPTVFLDAMREQFAANQMVVAWGEKGAYALDEDGVEIYSPAHPVKTMCETLGAGDTFIAGLIDALIEEQPLVSAMYQACGLAALKCATAGFELNLDQPNLKVGT